MNTYIRLSAVRGSLLDTFVANFNAFLLIRNCQKSVGNSTIPKESLILAVREDFERNFDREGVIGCSTQNFRKNVLQCSPRVFRGSIRAFISRIIELHV